MSLDLSKLSVAPWVAVHGTLDSTVFAGGRGLDASMSFNLPGRADAEFIALARNALDVMLRRGWAPVRYGDSRWVAEGEADDWMYRLGGDRSRIEGADPFTALVEADRWYKENVDQQPLPGRG